MIHSVKYKKRDIRRIKNQSQNINLSRNKIERKILTIQDTSYQKREKVAHKSLRVNENTNGKITK